MSTRDFRWNLELAVAQFGTQRALELCDVCGRDLDLDPDRIVLSLGWVGVIDPEERLRQILAEFGLRGLLFRERRVELHRIACRIASTKASGGR